MWWCSTEGLGCPTWQETKTEATAECRTGRLLQRSREMKMQGFAEREEGVNHRAASCWAVMRVGRSTWPEPEPEQTRFPALIRGKYQVRRRSWLDVERYHGVEFMLQSFHTTVSSSVVRGGWS